MRRRWTADEITRLLKEADRDLAKGLTVSDICRKHGIGQSMYYRWRQKRDPDKVDADRRCRELELEVDRLKKVGRRAAPGQDRCSRTLQKKSGEPGPTASRCRLPRARVTGSRNGGSAGSWGGLARCCDTVATPGRRAGLEPGDQTAGPSTSAVWIPHGSCPPAAARVDGQYQTSAEALDRAGAAAALEAEKSPGN